MKPRSLTLMSSNSNTLKNDHHLEFKDWRVYLKNTFIIMTSNVGSTTSTKSGSNIIEFTFGKEEHEHRLLALKLVVMKELIWQKCVGNKDPQFLINGIQNMIWKINNYKLYCFKKSPLKHKGLHDEGPRSHPKKGPNPEYTSQVNASNSDPESSWYQ